MTRPPKFPLFGVVLLAALAVVTALATALGWYIQAGRQAGLDALAAGRAADRTAAKAHFEDARAHFERALAVCPWGSDLHRLAARADRLLGDFPAAEAHLNRSIKLDGRASDAVKVEFLLIQVQSGDIDLVAKPLFELASAGHPEAPLLYETLANGYIRQLRYKLAWGCLDVWLQQDPSARAYFLRGFCFESLGNPKDAQKDYRLALAADPNLRPARLRLAEMYLEDKKVDEARAELEVLYQQDPADPLVRARLGMCRFLQGRTAEARELMEGAAAELPPDPALYIIMAQLDIQDDRRPEAQRGADAEARLRAVLKSSPADTEAWYNLAPALRLQNRTDEAAAALAEYERCRKLVDRANALLKSLPDGQETTAADLHELGTVLLSIGVTQAGVQWLNKALEKDPAHRPTLLALEAYYHQKGDEESARAYRARAGSPPAPAPRP